MFLRDMLRHATTQSTPCRVALFILASLALVEDVAAQTYTTNPGIGTYKNVGNGYRMRVTAISGSNVSIEVSHRTGGTFVEGGTAMNISKPTTTV